ncbi:MFS transporter [Smaragdicoccus niigatensis]|uniref:MFS transporter n=1 Tax=Smaragdicoccus niigatensis TaxID=359359 RepID=UPI000367DBB6|nr:MFS transporter [Smaragdicoccus niigatensis]
MSVTTLSAPIQPPELSPGRRMLILGTCCLSLFIVGIDVAAVNVALPSISHDLHASPTQLQWVVDAYTLVLASLLMLGGSQGDRFGRKRVFQIGLTLFAVGSLACSLAPTAGILIAARMLQAIGGSMMNPVAMSIITNTFIEPRERARAIGVWGGAVGLSLALGPVVGGALVTAVDWRAIFWINVPVAILAIALTGLFVPSSKAARPRRFDPLGQILVMTFLASLTYAIIEGDQLGWTSPTPTTCFAVAATSLALLIIVESRQAEPLIDPRLFRSLPFSGAVSTAILGFASMGGFLFLNTLYLQQVRGFSPLGAGLMTLPMAAATAVVSPISGRIVGSVGPRPPLLASAAFIGLSALMLTRLSDTTSFIYLGAAYLAFGIGFGLMNAPITNAAVAGMPRAQAGVAAAIASTSRQIGATLGVAILPAVVFGQIHGSVGEGLAIASRPAWWLMAAAAVLLFAIALGSTRRTLVP